MSKGLKALNSLFETMPFAFLESNTTRELNIIEKELKALEIIRTKCVDCRAFISDISATNEEESAYAFSPIDLTKEEVELLKEILL